MSTILPIVFHEGSGLFSIELKKTQFSLLQETFFLAEQFIDFYEFFLITGINSSQIMEFREKHLLVEESGTIVVNIHDIRLLFFVLKPVRYEIATLLSLLSEGQEDTSRGLQNDLSEFWGVICLE